MSRMRSGIAAAIVFLLASATRVSAADAGAVGSAPNFGHCDVPGLCLRDAGDHLSGGEPTRSAADFYAAGAGISGAQNGLAMAGDYMSAASFLGISGLVFASGFDGLIYSVGLLVGWPIVMFLIAERLRNLGAYTFADVASFRLEPVSIRSCRRSAR